MRTIAFASGKGGSGKTTLAVHMAEGLRRRGNRVLLVDLDPLGHATAWLLGLSGVGGKGTAEALLADAIQEEHLRAVPDHDGLHLLPATLALHGAEKAIAGEPHPDGALRAILRDAGERWDFAVLDCQPNIGTLTLNAIVAADGIVAPIAPTGLGAIGGLRLLESMVKKLQRRTGSEEEGRILGYVLFGADERTNLPDEVREVLRREAPGKLYRGAVRISVAGQALSFQRRTAWDDGADPRGAEDYPAILRETLARLEGTPGLRKVKG